MKKELQKYIMTHGLILGLIQTTVYYLAYFINSMWLASMWFGMVFLLLIGIYSVVAVKNYRKQQGGFMSLKEGFINMFFMLLVRSIIVTIFSILLFHVIDTNLAAFIKDRTIENTVGFMEKFNVPQEKVDKTVESLQDMDKQFTILAQFNSIVYGSIFSAIFAIIVAAILKKERNPFETDTTAPNNDNA